MVRRQAVALLRAGSIPVGLPRLPTAGRGAAFPKRRVAGSIPARGTKYGLWPTTLRRANLRPFIRGYPDLLRDATGVAAGLSRQ